MISSWTALLLIGIAAGIGVHVGRYLTERGGPSAFEAGRMLGREESPFDWQREGHLTALDMRGLEDRSPRISRQPAPVSKLWAVDEDAS